MILDHFSEITMRKIDCVSFQIVMLSNCTDLLYSVTPNVQEQLSHLIGNHNYSELRKIDEKIDFNRISVENNPKKHSHFALALPSGCASSSWKCLVPGLLCVLLFAPAQKLKGHLTFRRGNHSGEAHCRFKRSGFFQLNFASLLWFNLQFASPFLPLTKSNTWHYYRSVVNHYLFVSNWKHHKTRRFGFAGDQASKWRHPVQNLLTKLSFEATWACFLKTIHKPPKS